MDRILGIFAKYPAPGAVKTRLAAEMGDAVAAELARNFLLDTLDRCAPHADRVVVAYAPGTEAAAGAFRHLLGSGVHLWPQPEGDLGTRLKAFFQDHLQHPGDRVMAIGGDSPSLPTDFLTHAFQALEEQDCVLGPAADGGYYLLGLSRQIDRLFDGIPWGTHQVLQETAGRIIQVEATLKLLPVWYDVDTPAELALLQGHLTLLRQAGVQDLPQRTVQQLGGVPPSGMGAWSDSASP